MSLVVGACLITGHAPGNGENDAAGIAQLISQLESGKFEERRRAEITLDKIGEPAFPALHQALADRPSLELRRRLEMLVTNIERRARLDKLAARLLREKPKEQIKVLDDLEDLNDLDGLASRIAQITSNDNLAASKLLREISWRQRVLELLRLLASPDGVESGKAEQELAEFGAPAVIPIINKVQKTPERFGVFLTRSIRFQSLTLEGPSIETCGRGPPETAAKPKE